MLTFFAQDAGTHNLIYANADISKATQAREVIAFCEHWRALTGTDPGLLVFDQKLTTQAVLSELDQRGVTFMTLRMRSPALIRTSTRSTRKRSGRSAWTATATTASPRSSTKPSGCRITPTRSAS